LCSIKFKKSNNKEFVGSEIIFENNKGHFTDETDITKIPSALTSLLETAA